LTKYECFHRFVAAAHGTIPFVQLPLDGNTLFFVVVEEKASSLVRPPSPTSQSATNILVRFNRDLGAAARRRQSIQKVDVGEREDLVLCAHVVM
jgi:hypothetical protein